MDQRCYITWSHQPPSVINFNPSQSYFFGYGIVSGPTRTSNHQDAINVARCLISNEIVPANNVITFANNSSDFSDSYTLIKLAKAFKFQASNVESDGILTFYYSGGADLATALTDRTRNHSGLSVCALSTNDDPPSLFTSLDTSISARFLSTAISKLRAGQGVLQVTNVYDFTARCCEAFFKLILTYDPVAKRVIDAHVAQPTLTALGKPRLVEMGSSEETDQGPPGAMQFLAKYFHHGMAGAPLHQYAYDWLQRAGDVAEGPLADLLRLGVLGDDVVTCAVICVMMQALASVQIAFGEAADVDSANRLLVAFTAVAATVSSIARDSAELEERHFRLAWNSYCKTTENSGFAVPNIRGMLEDT
eukprot:Em0388g6a